jgi:hypothetical protein
MLRYLCSRPNKKPTKKAWVPELFSDDQEEIDAFVALWDKPGRAVYWCVNPLKPSSTTRCIATVAYVERVHFDLDHKDFESTPEEIDTYLLHLPLQPTVVNDSGGGRQGFYELKEPIDTDDIEMTERVTLILKRLTAALGADPMPAHIAALMRVAGSHNSKREGEPVLVAPVWGSGEPVDITDLEDLLDRLPEQTILKRKEVMSGNGRATPSGGSTQGPINVDQRLADMTIEGPGNSAVHVTELQVVASLLRQGLSLESTVQTVLEEMQERLAGDPRAATWKWEPEERKLEKMGLDFIAKNPDLDIALPDDLRDQFRAAAGKRRRFVYNSKAEAWHVRAFGVVDGGLDDSPQEAPRSSAGAPLFKTALEFTASFIPPDYSVDGVLQRRFLYSLTAQTGDGKTAFALLLAYCVAEGMPLGA